MMHNTQKRFYQLVDTMVSFNKEIRRYLPEDIYHNLGTISFAKEYASIHCDIGRRTGKTKYILEHASANDLIIVHNEETRRRINFEIQAKVQVIRSEELTYMQRQVVCCEACRRPYDNIRVYDTIWVDEPRLCFRNSSVERMYNVLAYRPRQTFILLGE